MKNNTLKSILSCILLILTIVSCENSQNFSDADTIYINGNVIRMTAETDLVESVAILDGKILDYGIYNSLKKYKGKHTNIIDLKGKTLMPGFIDAHSHLTQGIYEFTQANVSAPPVGECNSILDILNQLVKFKEEHNIQDGEWILGYGYDNELLLEKRHPNRFELDSVFPNNPVVIGHVSLHMGVCNTTVLEMLNYNENTPNPPGGHIERNKDNKLTGLLQENAAFAMMSVIPQISTEEKVELLDDILNLYASNGYTTIQDGVSNKNDLQFLKEGQKQNKYFIDVVSLPEYINLDDYLLDTSMNFGVYDNGLKYGGIKIIGDGSPQGKTAFFSHPYCSHGDCDTTGFRGQPNITQAELNKVIKKAYQNGIQVNMHCNGDGAIDMLIKSHEKNISFAINNNLRTVIIHAQFITRDQLNKVAKLNFIPSFFTNHAYFWGDAHLNNLGEDRANFLSPIASADKLGIKYTNHTDYLITPLDPMFVIWTAVNRTTRNGVTLGHKEKATPYQALKGITINAAYQYFEEDTKGSIEKGKHADLVILSDNPLTIECNDIKDIEILETIKEGQTVYKK